MCNNFNHKFYAEKELGRNVVSSPDSCVGHSPLMKTDSLSNEKWHSNLFHQFKMSRHYLFHLVKSSHFFSISVHVSSQPVGLLYRRNTNHVKMISSSMEERERSEVNGGNLRCVLLEPGVRRSDDNYSPLDHNGGKTSEEGDGIRKSADQISCQDTSKLTYLWKIASISYHEQYPTAILRRREDRGRRGEGRRREESSQFLGGLWPPYPLQVLPQSSSNRLHDQSSSIVDNYE